jgi:hypothetical protein
LNKVRRAESVSDAEVDPFPDKPFRPPEILASVDVTPLRGRRTWALGEAPATDVSTAASLPYVLLEDVVQAATDAAAAAQHPTAAATPQRQTVGAAPRDASSLEGLLLHLSAAVLAAAPMAAPAAAPASVPVAGSAPVVTTTAAAVERILAAAAVGKTFAFVRPNPKTGKSRERCEVYKADTPFAGLEALKCVNFTDTTRPVL